MRSTARVVVGCDTLRDMSQTGAGFASNRVSERLRPFGTSIFSEMTALANAHKAINLSQGFPDFDGPGFIKDAACEAIRGGQNQYARSYGVPSLVEAISRRWIARCGGAIDPDAQVCVTSGCTEALAATFLGLIDPGDEVVMFEPTYDSYRAGVAMAGGIARLVRLRPEGGGWVFDEGEFARAFTARTRAVLVNTPHNPTGKVFTRDELACVASACQKWGAWAITDEVYEHLVLSPGCEHVSLGMMPGMEDRTLTLSSLGKTFSLTGWKIGWAVGPRELVGGVKAAHQFLTFASGTPFQHGGAAALALGGPGEAYIASLAGELAARKESLVSALEACGFSTMRSDGTYFVMAGFDRIGGRGAGIGDDVTLARTLTAEAGVACIPASAFYDPTDPVRRYVRFAFCKRAETIEAATARLSAWVGRDAEGER